MYNFNNLNDVEFEYLCKDIMSRMLNINLHRFGAGKDRGIDLVDDVHAKNVIVQIKHYIKSDVSGLFSSLRKEIYKVKRLNPMQYYICCSKTLSPNNQEKIYDMFSDYMETANNIITLTEISDFLDCEKNKDILHKHYKLWIESTNVLNDIYTKDITIDCDALIYDIKETEKLFVKTKAFDKALGCLEEDNILMIIGGPGVGKTITSKMLVLYYAAMGFKVRYTTDGTNLSSLKKALSISPLDKEIILLDDCFGQAYFNMKETQENELISLIKHIKSNKNKILIMNSRITIYKEANERNINLVKSIDRKEYKVFVLDMSNISYVDRAKIFYNHLYFCNIPKEYRDNIKKELNYRKIIRHVNYNPRIMEFVTNGSRLLEVKSNEYSDFIVRCLNNPEQIWKDEFERKITNFDRIFLNTLYSLTNTLVSKDLVKACFIKRLSMMQGLDTSIDYFEQSMKRLEESMIKTLYDKGKIKLSVLNPSINDFLSHQLKSNLLEKESIIKSSASVLQLKRLLNDIEYEYKIKAIINDHSIMSFYFENERQRRDFITYFCVMYKVLDEFYELTIKEYVSKMNSLDICYNNIPVENILDKIFTRSFVEFYDLERVIKTIYIQKLYELKFHNAVKYILNIDYLFKGTERENYIIEVKDALEKLLIDYCKHIWVDDYIDDLDFINIIDSYCFNEECNSLDEAIYEIDELVVEQVLEQVNYDNNKLPIDLKICEKFLNDLHVNVEGSSNLVEDYLLDKSYDKKIELKIKEEYENSEIDYIFNR